MKTTRQEEFEYYERLGPLTRAVLQDSCHFLWSTLDILREMGRRNWDPENANYDRMMAKEIIRLDKARRPKSGLNPEEQARSVRLVTIRSRGSA